MPRSREIGADRDEWSQDAGNVRVWVTRRGWGESRANQSLKWIFGGREIYGPIPRRLWDDAGSIKGAISGARRPKFGLVSLGCLLLRCRFKSLKMLLFYAVGGFSRG